MEGSPKSLMKGLKPCEQDSSAEPQYLQLFATILLCGRLGSRRTWGQLPSGSSVLVFLPIEEISLEKAGKVALME